MVAGEAVVFSSGGSGRTARYSIYHVWVTQLPSYTAVYQHLQTRAIYLLFIGSIMMLGYLIMFGNKEVQKKIAPNLVVAVIAITRRPL